MVSEKMQREFERAFTRKFGFGPLLASANADAKQMLDAAEWAWKESRESLNIDAAAKALAESMDYPWEFMPEQGRARMKANARMVIEAAGLKVKP